MQIVIDIPDDWERRIKCNIRPNTIECGELVESIWNGKMLPKGKWVNSKCRDGCYLPCCSVCGESSGTYYEYNYCPNCGAKMEEVENGNKN